MFIDKAVIQVSAGDGGSGIAAFRRESLVPLGGPSGGDGGRGGDVILVADSNLSTLLDFRYRAEYRAESGNHGEGNNRTGRSGESLELRVPPGTVARDADTGEFVGELLRGGERLIVAKGGRGGRGNARFATATRQAPTKWQPGGDGEARRLELELKLIADAGLVGEPNAGKSTLLSAISEARPKVAPYPFTTLSPNLGVVQLSDYRTFVMADIPGIIEGAHEGRGLGLQFLRHIERTRTLAFMVPVDDEDPQAVYDRLRAEVRAYSPSLAAKPHCLVLTRTDLLGPDDPVPEVSAPEAWGIFPISSVAGWGLEPLLEGLWLRAREAREREVSEDGPGDVLPAWDEGVGAAPVDDSGADPTAGEEWTTDLS
jgi:GTPase